MGRCLSQEATTMSPLLTARSCTIRSGSDQKGFTPRKPGPYRIWVDLRPSPMGLQEYVMADIPAATEHGTPTNKLVNYSTIVEGLKYELTLAQQKIRVGYPVPATLRISNPDGTGFARLEP